MTVILHVDKENRPEKLCNKLFMVEMSAPQTRLLNVTQNHVPLKDLLRSTANGVHGGTVTLPVDQEFKIEPFWSKPNMMGRTVLKVIPWSATSINHVLQKIVNGVHGANVLLHVDQKNKVEKFWLKP